VKIRYFAVFRISCTALALAETNEALISVQEQRPGLTTGISWSEAYQKVLR